MNPLFFYALKPILTLISILSYMSGHAQEYIITPNMIGNTSLGDEMTVLRRTFPQNTIHLTPGSQYGVDGPGNGFLISLNPSDTLMFVWSKDYGKTIGGIVCLSSSYKIVDNLCIGSTLGDIEKLHPYIYLVPSYLNASIEYVTVRYSDGSINLEVISQQGKQIGIYEPNSEDEPSTKNYDRSVKINRMVIWK